jgi:hypothetical protein
MSFVQLGDGKYEAQFNGASVPCVASADCVDALNHWSVCNENVTADPFWATSNTCICPRFYQGESCSELVPITQFEVVLDSFFAGLGLLTAFYGLFLLARAVSQAEKKGNALHITLACSCAGLLGMVLELSYMAHMRITANERRGFYYEWDALAVTVGFVFTTIALLNVSLLWIEIAERTRKGRGAAIANVKKYRRGCCTFTTLW